MNNPQPPYWAKRFFQWYCDPRLGESILGDLEEQFEEDIENFGFRRAKRRFTWNVIRFFRPGITKKLEGSQSLNNYGMLKHFFLIALRGFRKDRKYALVNLLGLSLSFCICLLIWIYVSNENRFDSYHHNAEHKYRINLNYYKEEGLKLRSVLTTRAMGTEMETSVPGIKNMVRVRPIMEDEGLLIADEDNKKKFLEFNVSYVEPSFLEFFNYPLKRGSTNTALSSPNSIVLTKEAAHKFFNDEDPIGKVLQVKAGSLSGDFTVSGVLDELPSGTHLDFDYLIPIDFLISNYGLYERANGWQLYNFFTYLEVEEEVDQSRMTQQIDELFQDKMRDELNQTAQSVKSSFQPIERIYLDAPIEGEEGLFKGSNFNINAFSIIAVFILIIACINYVNLASAKAFAKKSEVSLRRAIGANKAQLIYQFMTEALMFLALAMLCAITIAYFLLPDFGRFIGSNLDHTLLMSESFILAIVLTVVTGSLVAGLYPALLSLRLDAFNTSKKSNLTQKGSYFKKSLMVFQLSVSIVLIAGTWLVYHQLTYMQSAKLGVDTQQTFVVKGSRAVVGEGPEVAKSKLNLFKEILIKHSNIEGVCTSSNTPGTGEIWYGGIRKTGDSRDQEIQADAILADKDFTNIYEMKFLAGGPFPEGMSDYEVAIINERAMKALGISNPGDALNFGVILEDMDTMKIHGVVKDVHWNSLHEEIQPTVFGGVKSFAAFLSIKMRPNDLSASLELIEDTYRELYPGDPYEGYFLDEDFNRQYESEQKFAQIFSLFSISALLISSLGLFALISYALAQKVKEIGIRKVLGAGAKQLFLLLSKEYIQIFSIATLIAMPVIFYSAKTWLENYAYRIAIGTELFLAPVFIVALFTLLFISNKILTSMQVDPAKQLRDE